MRPRLILFALGLAALTLGAPSAHGQIPWESPMLLSPGAPGGVSLHFVRFDYSIENSLGAVATFRPQSGVGGTGYRVAVAEGNLDHELAFAGGLDWSGMLQERNRDFPVDLMWFAGLGAGYADYLTVSVPFGIAFGRTLEGRAAWFSPYMSTRAVVEQGFGDSAPPDEGVSVGIAVDVGADVALGSQRGFILRLGASLGDRQTLVAGVHIGSP